MTIEKEENGIEFLTLSLRHAIRFGTLVKDNKELEDKNIKLNVVNKKLVAEKTKLMESNKELEEMKRDLDDENKEIKTEIELKKNELEELEKDNYKMKYEKQLEQANEDKAPIFQSTHTFEKCYNIPTRNFCYRIRKKVPLRFKEAHDLTNMIDDSIDLWANQFSMELYDPRTKNIEDSKSIKWIDSFSWKPFEEDLKKFIEQYFIMNINDLFDHYTNQFFKKDNKVIVLSDIYDKMYSWDDFISFEFDKDQQNLTDKEQQNLMGVRPFFRATLINMISNAVEAMDFYNIIVQDNSDKASIEIVCKQNSDKTTIELQSQGKKMSDERVAFYNEVIFDLAKNGKLKLSETCLEKDIHDKKFTTKPGIGSGYALIHAAHYFSRIERENNDSDKPERGQMRVETNGNKTTFRIELPFGKTTTELYKNKETYYSKNNSTRFRWHKSLVSENGYEKIQDKVHLEPDNHLSKEPILKEKIDQIPEDNNREVLIIEDSRPDRFRMRMSNKSKSFGFLKRFEILTIMC